MTILFGRTQDAYDTPFNKNDPLAVAAGITNSDTVFEAILEAKTDSLNNDRYPFEAHFGGNANVGRYLEIFPALASFPDAPFVFPENSAIKTVTLGCSASATAVIGFFRTTNLVTPVFSVSLTNQTRGIFTGLNHLFNANDELAIRVTSGSLNRPFMRIWVNTVT